MKRYLLAPGLTPIQERKDSGLLFTSIKELANGTRKKVKLKETALNHSKLVRRIEQKCRTLFIDVNIGIIIQMNFQEKIALKNQIEKVWNFREKNDPEK